MTELKFFSILSKFDGSKENFLCIFLNNFNKKKLTSYSVVSKAWLLTLNSFL